MSFKLNPVNIRKVIDLTQALQKLLFRKKLQNQPEPKKQGADLDINKAIQNGDSK